MRGLPLPLPLPVLPFLLYRRFCRKSLREGRRVLKPLKTLPEGHHSTERLSLDGGNASVASHHQQQKHWKSNALLCQYHPTNRMTFYAGMVSAIVHRPYMTQRRCRRARRSSSACWIQCLYPHQRRLCHPLPGSHSHARGHGNILWQYHLQRPHHLDPRTWIVAAAKNQS